MKNHLRLYLTPIQRRICKQIVAAGQEPRFVFDPLNPAYVELQSFLAGDTVGYKPDPENETEPAEKQPVLDRKTRGQVTRVTNKLQTVEHAEFPSSSNPKRKYRTVIYQNGKVLCNCQGWTMKRGDNPRQCRHTAELLDGRATKTDGEFLYLESLAIASGTLRFSEEGAC